MACRKCARLIEHCREIARVKRRAYLKEDYWGGPVPSFGPANARLLILGLAPGAHGANRTGRVFTGDSSGNLLYRVLHATGFATQPVSVSRNDGLEMLDARISCAAHCAPPGNRPLPGELRNCRSWLEQEVARLENLRIVVPLGKLAFDAYVSVLRSQGRLSRSSRLVFGHNREQVTGPADPIIIPSYHPSQQNTSTGRLTEPMLREVFERARRYLHGAA